MATTKKADSRIYVVKSKGSENNPADTSLVRAKTKAAALRHLAAQVFVADVAKQQELVDLVTAGVQVEDAGEADAEEE